MTHSRTSPKGLVSQLLRVPLQLIPPMAILPVLSGPMRGMRWVAGSAPHGAWLGTLERVQLRRFVRRLGPGMTVWNIGANVGLYALASALAVGPAGRVYAFEPMPRNAHFLRQHVVLNHLTNIEVCEMAVAEHGLTLSMTEGDSPSEFHADPEGD